MIQYSNLMDNGVLLEYQLPQTSKRLDCMITGKDYNNSDNVMILLNGAIRDVLHPSVQVGRYQMYLEDTSTAFYDNNNPVKLYSCTYLHNYNYYSDDVIFDSKFKNYLAKALRTE